MNHLQIWHDSYFVIPRSSTGSSSVLILNAILSIISGLNFLVGGGLYGTSSSSSVSLGVFGIEIADASLVSACASMSRDRSSWPSPEFLDCSILMFNWSVLWLLIDAGSAYVLLIKLVCFNCFIFTWWCVTPPTASICDVYLFVVLVLSFLNMNWCGCVVSCLAYSAIYLS